MALGNRSHRTTNFIGTFLGLFAAFCVTLTLTLTLLVERGKRDKAASYVQQAVCVRKKKSTKKNTTKSRRIQNTPRYAQQQPGNREHLETARDETRPTR